MTSNYILGINIYLHPSQWRLIPYGSVTDGMLVWQITWLFLQIQVIDSMRITHDQIKEMEKGIERINEGIDGPKE